MIATVAPYLLPIALPNAIAALPRTPLHLVEDLTDRLLASLYEGALDGAVIATEPDGDKLMAVTLYEEPFFLVSARSGEESRSGSIRVEDIDPSTLLLLAEGHCLRDQALALCDGAGNSPLGADVRATSLETLRHLVSAGQGATLAPLLAYAGWRRLGAGLDGRQGHRTRGFARRHARLSARLAAQSRARGAWRLATRIGGGGPGRCPRLTSEAEFRPAQGLSARRALDSRARRIRRIALTAARA